MVLLTWGWSKPPANEEMDKSSWDFNYEPECGGWSGQFPVPEDRLLCMKRRGFAMNHSRVKIGHGKYEDYNKAKKLLQDWRHFQLGWAFVAPQTPIELGQAFSVCSREFMCWIVNPLRIRYVYNDRMQLDKLGYAFGSGTLQGHLLAGEERFAVEWNKEDGTIWYEIFSFSKPAHFLSLFAYPYVRFKQRLFAKHSSEKMIQEMSKT